MDDILIQVRQLLGKAELVAIGDESTKGNHSPAFQNFQFVNELSCRKSSSPHLVCKLNITNIDDISPTLEGLQWFSKDDRLIISVQNPKNNRHFQKHADLNTIITNYGLTIESLHPLQDGVGAVLRKIESAEQITQDEVANELMQAWKFSDSVFELISPDAFYERPILLRHPFIFYLGHLPAFGHNQVCNYLLKNQSFNPYFDEIFERGIDPIVDDPNKCHDHSYVPPSWPKKEEVLTFKKKARELMIEAIPSILKLKSEVMAYNGRVYAMTCEHDFMHAETLCYMYLNLDKQWKVIPSEEKKNYKFEKSSIPKGKMIQIPAGTATLGADFHEIRYGWDNEFPKQRVDVPTFKIAELPVTVGEYLKFVKSGEYENPKYWNESDWKWKEAENLRHPNVLRKNGENWFYKTVFDEIPVEKVMDWPIYCSQAEAWAYAKWKGKRLPSEPEFMRAAYGKLENSAEMNTFPWGEEKPVPGVHGNFNFYSYAPTPVGIFPKGKSEFGVLDMIGSGWEWTCTPFEGLPGFDAYIPHYQGYSKDFFDGKHFTMLGASWATATPLVRRSFRNWFQSHYQYMFSKFRLAED